jgi:hypothetical protein
MVKAVVQEAEQVGLVVVELALQVKEIMVVMVVVLPTLLKVQAVVVEQVK